MFQYNPENTVIRGLTKVFDMLWLTVLWLACSLPVITFGAATTAMMKVTLDLMDDQEGEVTKQFFSAFTQNLKIATLAWFLMLLAGAVLAGDIYVCFFAAGSGTFVEILRGITVFFCVVYMFVASYLFAGIARFVVTVRQAFQNALLLAIRHIPTTLCLVFLTVVFAVACFYLLWYAVFVIGGIFYMQALLLGRVFHTYVREDAALQEKYKEIQG